MAKKDTLNALMKRGATLEEANTLIRAFSTMGAIGESTAEAIADLGIPEDRAAAIIKAIRDKPTSSSPRAKKAPSPEPQPAKFFETFSKLGACDAAEMKL